MAKQTFVADAILTAAQMNALQGNDFNQTVSTKTTSYTLVAADAGTKIVMNSASATTITVNTSLFAAGDTLTILNIAAGVCTVTAGTATVSTTGTLALVQNAGGTLYFTSAGVSVFQADGIAAGAAQTFAIFNETQANGTDGGTFTSGSMVKRTLNTTVVNTITSCTLTSSVISLPAGTYYVDAIAPADGVNSHKIRLRNTTASTTLATGQNAFPSTGVTSTSNSLTVFTLTATSNIELQHECQTTKATSGLGGASGFSGSNEIYSQISITKIA